MRSTIPIIVFSLMAGCSEPREYEAQQSFDNVKVRVCLKPLSWSWHAEFKKFLEVEHAGNIEKKELFPDTGGYAWVALINNYGVLEVKTLSRVDEVVAVVKISFPESAHTRVLELLDGYGVEPYERERERVQLAILKLSEGNEEKLQEFVAGAKRDYRDVLFWADNPEEAKFDTPEKRERLRKMFEQFGIKPPEDL
jgi:hypothetical protein